MALKATIVALALSSVDSFAPAATGASRRPAFAIIHPKRPMPILQYRRARAQVSHVATTSTRIAATICNNHAGSRGAALRAADTVVPADRVFSAAEAKGGAAIDASKTALLLVEYQNEFTTEGGKLHDAVKESMAATGMLERSAKLADEARNKARRRVVYETLLLLDGVPDNKTLLPRRASRSSMLPSRSRRTPRTIRTKALASSPAAPRTGSSRKGRGTPISRSR